MKPMIAGMLTSPVVITKAKTPPINASGRFSKITPDSFTLRNSLYNNRKITTILINEVNANVRLAKVILGGLLTSTFLNGFIVPIVYLMMHRKKTPKSL